MRAVNLIPNDERRGAGGAAGASGGGVYVLLGTLALLVVMAAAWAIAGKNLNDKKSELAQVNRETAAATAKAKQLEAYTRFSGLRAKRVETVTSLAKSRFDWSHALHEISRVMPNDAWLTALTGTVTTGVQIDGASSTTGSLRGALPNPAIEVSGCTTSQKAVARILTRMRLIDGVERVSLSDSVKADSAGGGGATSSAGGGDCRNGSDKFPQFNMVVFFKAPAAPAAPAAAGGQAAAGTTTTASATTPAAGSSSSSSQPASGGNTP